MSWQPAEAVLLAHLGEGAAAAWFCTAVTEVRALATVPDGDALARHFSAAGRRLGRAALTVAEGGATDEDVRLTADGPALAAGPWALDELGRAVLLHAALEAAAGEGAAAVARVEALFRAGELREQQAVARCLGYLPAPVPTQLVPLAIEIVRSNAAALLEAIACANPFPAAHLPDAAFNQMVVKCLFVGLSLTRILGLERRRSAELGRMVAAYASERRAAGRAVAPDAALLL